MTKDEILIRGEQADALLKSGVFKQCMAAVETEICEEWKATRPEDEEGRKRMYLMIQLQADYLRMLTRWQNDALMARAEAERAKQAVR